MAPKRHPVPDLGDLDDAILLKCFSLLTPLPDLFNVAASCRVSALHRFSGQNMDLNCFRGAAYGAAGPSTSRPATRQQAPVPRSAGARKLTPPILLCSVSVT